MSNTYLQPPVLVDSTGQQRRAGFEFEFGNLPITETARSLQQALGGDLELLSPFEAVLRNSTLGRLKVERDADLLKSRRYLKLLGHLGVEFSPGSLAHGIETTIDSASKILIPCEVVTDPIPFDKLFELDRLVHTLDGLGAEGTQQSVIYAFGMHINPSLPDNSSDTLRRYLQAFLLLHAWIVESSEIDLTRRYLTKYIDPFPQPYMDLLLDRAYLPDRQTLVRDYMLHNPTRNRALDMLPIFCHLEEELVLPALNEDERNLVKGRSAFHYRLPDCKVNVPGWSAANAWNQWVSVEKLAADEDLLGELIDAWCETSEKFSLVPNTTWILRLTTILSQKFFAR